MQPTCHGEWPGVSYDMHAPGAASLGTAGVFFTREIDAQNMRGSERAASKLLTLVPTGR